VEQAELDFVEEGAACGDDEGFVEVLAHWF